MRKIETIEEKTHNAYIQIKANSKYDQQMSPSQYMTPRQGTARKSIRMITVT